MKSRFMSEGVRRLQSLFGRSAGVGPKRLYYFGDIGPFEEAMTKGGGGLPSRLFMWRSLDYGEVGPEGL